MAARRKKPVTRNSVIANTIESSVSNMMAALNKVDKAVTVKSSQSKKMMNETRRLKKRRLTQMNKKKRAVAADKKGSSGATRKIVRSITAELGATKKALVKTTTARQAVLQELSGLKESQKKLRAYVKGIVAADRRMARPKRRRAKR